MEHDDVITAQTAADRRVAPLIPSLRAQSIRVLKFADSFDSSESNQVNRFLSLVSGSSFTWYCCSIDEQPSCSAIHLSKSRAAVKYCLVGGHNGR